MWDVTDEDCELAYYWRLIKDQDAGACNENFILHVAKDSAWGLLYHKDMLKRSLFLILVRPILKTLDRLLGIYV